MHKVSLPRILSSLAGLFVPLFLLLFSVSTAYAGNVPPRQNLPTTSSLTNPASLDFVPVYVPQTAPTKEGGKLLDIDMLQVTVSFDTPVAGSYKVVVNSGDPDISSPCATLNQGINKIPILMNPLAGSYLVEFYENKTSLTSPLCGKGNKVASDILQITQAKATTTTTAVGTNVLVNPALAAPAPAAPAPPTTCTDPNETIDTAIGRIPVCDLNAFAKWFVGWAIGIGGGIAFLLILWSGFQIMTSSGNPDRLKAGKEQLTAAITGLLFLVFSVFLLQLIGVEILRLPGL